MKSIRSALMVAALLAAATALCRAQAAPELPKPQKEHKWLERFVGQWTSEAKASMGPDQPPMMCKGTSRARMLGGFWLISEGQADMMGIPMKSVLTLGFDPKRNRYVGTWTDSVSSHMWHYEGELDGVGKLTLHSEGPHMMVPGKTAKYRETVEFKSDDHYVFTSMLQGDDGKWMTFATADFRRVK